MSRPLHRILLFFCVVLLCLAAGYWWLQQAQGRPLRLLIHQQLSAAALDKLRQISLADPGLEIVPVTGTGGADRVDALLAEGKVDLALVENSQAFSDTIQVVAPLFRSVLHILYRADLSFDSPQDLLTRHSLYVDPGSYTSGRLFELLRQRQSIADDQLNLAPAFVPGETQVMITFAPLFQYHRRQALQGYRLMAIDQVDRLGQGSSIEAIRLLFPQLSPFVIPAQTYQDMGNSEAIVTASVTVLLVARPDLPESTVYRLTRALYHRRNQLAQLLPSVFEILREDFDSNGLNFPLHPGARRYLERDAPGMLERYAEVINVLVYLVVLFVTGMAAFLRWNRQRKKDRIDEFYRQILELKLRARDCAGTRPAQQIREQLDRFESQAFELLIAEKLAADESFRILITLIQEVRQLLPVAEPGGRA